MMRTQMDYIFRKRTEQKYFFSLAVIDKKTYMKTNTRLLIYMNKQRSGPAFLSGAPNENKVQNHLNIAVLKVF